MLNYHIASDRKSIITLAKWIKLSSKSEPQGSLLGTLQFLKFELVLLAAGLASLLRILEKKLSQLLLIRRPTYPL